MRRLAIFVTGLTVLMSVATFVFFLLAIWGDDSRWADTGGAFMMAAIVVGGTAARLWIPVVDDK